MLFEVLVALQGGVEGAVLGAVHCAVIVSSDRFQSRNSDKCANLPWHVQTLFQTLKKVKVRIPPHLHTRSITSQGKKQPPEQEGQVGTLKTRYLLWVQIC